MTSSSVRLKALTAVRSAMARYTGAVIWSFTTAGGVQTGPALASDGTIYIASGDKKIYAVNSNGTLKWSQVEPLLVTRNDKGEIEGVKYDRLNIVLINAIKEQQAQVGQLQGQLKGQQALIENLRKLVCSQNPQAEVCK